MYWPNQDILQEANNSESELPEARRYFHTECRKGAEEIVRFISSLREDNFKEFWLPCTQPLPPSILPSIRTDN